MREIFSVTSAVSAVVVDKDGHVMKVGGVETNLTSESPSGAGA
jgi:hypothetical protein